MEVKKRLALQRFHTVINPVMEPAESKALGGADIWNIFRMKHGGSLMGRTKRFITPLPNSTKGNPLTSILPFLMNTCAIIEPGLTIGCFDSINQATFLSKKRIRSVCPSTLAPNALNPASISSLNSSLVSLNSVRTP